jgi:hypothetical protein
MGSGISLNNKQALEIFKNEIKHIIKIKKSFSVDEKNKYEELLEFFKEHDKLQNCNPEYEIYRNWLLDCEYARLTKKL